MRIGIAISCADADSQKIIDDIIELCKEKEAKVFYVMKTVNEIRIVEKPKEKIPEEL